MTTRSAFFASDLTAFATPFSETDLRISASMSSEGSTFCQFEYFSGYSGLRTWPFRPTETHSSPFQVKVWCGMLRYLPSLTDPSARDRAIFFAAFAFSEIISRILLSFITQCRGSFHYTHSTTYKCWSLLSSNTLRLGVHMDLHFGGCSAERLAQYTPH